MSHTCDVCRGALPDGVGHAGHTALCAQVVLEELVSARARIESLETAIGRLLDGNEAAKESNITHLRDVLDGHAK